MAAFSCFDTGNLAGIYKGEDNDVMPLLHGFLLKLFATVFVGMVPI